MVRNRMIAAAVGAGLAATACGQDVTLHFDLDGDPLTSDIVPLASRPVFTWTVYASFTGFDDPSAYFGGFVGSFWSIGDGVSSNPVSLMTGVGTTPQASGASITGINIFHSALLGTDDPANPLAIFRFETTGTATELSYRATGLASVFASDDIFASPFEFDNFTVISDRLVPFPAPGTGSALGLGVLVAARRRR